MAHSTSTVELSPVTEGVQHAASIPLDKAFEERWHAWRQRGAWHELAVRRRFFIAVPAVLIAAATVYALFAR